MQNAIITIKIDKQTKDDAQNLADQLGFSLSSVIKAQLKYFIRSKKINVSLLEKPNSYFDTMLAKSEKEVKEGHVVSFSGGKDALAYVNSVIKNDKKSAKQ